MFGAPFGEGCVVVPVVVFLVYDDVACVVCGGGECGGVDGDGCVYVDECAGEFMGVGGGVLWVRECGVVVGGCPGGVYVLVGDVGGSVVVFEVGAEAEGCVREAGGVGVEGECVGGCDGGADGGDVVVYFEDIALEHGDVAGDAEVATVFLVVIEEGEEGFGFCGG